MQVLLRFPENINGNNSMKHYQYLLFDLDGTLTDSQEGIINSIRYALGKLGITENDEDKLLTFIGPPFVNSLREHYGFDESRIGTAVTTYREYFTSKGIYENRLYPGVAEMLGRVRESGKNLVLATSKPEVYALRILELFGIREYFGIVSGSSLDGSISVKSDIIRRVFEQTGDEHREKSIMIGDRKHDILGARENGIDSVGVLYGYGKPEEITAALPTYTVRSVAELTELFQV